MTRLELIGRLLLEFGEGEFTREGLVRVRGETHKAPGSLLLYPLGTAGVLAESSREGYCTLYKLTPRALDYFERGEEP